MSFDPAWEAEHASRPWGRWPNEHLVRFVARHFRRPATFLELGCGAGAQVAMLVAAGHTVTAIDGSPAALKRAAERARSEFSWGAAGTVAWAVADVPTFTATAKSLDCVVDIACLQHLDLAEAAGVTHRALTWLKPGGRFFSLMTSMASDLQLVSPSGVNVRREDRAGVEAIFAGYKTAVGHERIERPIGGVIGNWIIEAQRPA